MSLVGRSVVSINDLSNDEIISVLDLARDIEENPQAYRHLCGDAVMASLFCEPSTRTRISFETAMHRLGGAVVPSVGESTLSLAKGESLSDTARIIGSYVDVIVLRHPWEGSARVFADEAGVPVINGGDGAHEHPTQTLVDLYTLRKKKDSFEGLTVALCGDLRYGRTVHSLAYALARFDSNLYCLALDGLDMPEHVERRLANEYNRRLQKGKIDSRKPLLHVDAAGINVVYLTKADGRQGQRQRNMPVCEPQVTIRLTENPPVMLYMTRVQKERLPKTHREGPPNGRSFLVDAEFWQDEGFKDTFVMHPLPRVGEIHPAVDNDPRSLYFEQAKCGVPVRMALLGLVLGAVEAPQPSAAPAPHPRGYVDDYADPSAPSCGNERCVTRREAGSPPSPLFHVIESEGSIFLRCRYCDTELKPSHVGSVRGHKYDVCTPEKLRTYKQRDKIRFFMNRGDAEDAGFAPVKPLRAPGSPGRN